MELDNNLQNLTEEFIYSQVIGRGLDERTAKAYRLDLERFYRWLESEKNLLQNGLTGSELKKRMETYLEYLAMEKELRLSTVNRKQKVFGYYLSYLEGEGVSKKYLCLEPVIPTAKRDQENVLSNNILTKQEVDDFFRAIKREYQELDSDFRKRICLRDQVMMELLFYHKIEISELLRMKIADYDRRTSILTIPRKREKRRSVHLFSKTLQIQMEQWLEEHRYFENKELYSEYMFLSKLGKPLSMKMVINIFDKYRVLAGIQKECTPKDLKNSLERYAVEMVREMG